MYTTQTSLAELATQLPAASRVFHHHHLDFCCGGRASLAAACATKKIDAAAVLAEIESASATTPPGPEVMRMTVPALIDHILERYHQPLPAELARLRAMAEKVERVHADKPDVPHGLAAHVAAVESELLDHLAKEEQVLFPMLRASVGVAPRGPIAVMLREHDDHAENLRKTRRLAHDLVPPPAACNTWRALYLGLDALERELMEHIHLENNVLFPRVLAD